MLAIVEAKKLLESAGINGLDAVYTRNLPKELQENTDKTIVLIDDVSEELSGFGNNDFSEVVSEVKLQVFHKLDIDYPLESFEKSILKLFFDNHWGIQNINGKIYDPDTEQLTWTVYLNKVREI